MERPETVRYGANNQSRRNIFGAEELKYWQKVWALGCVSNHRTMTIVLVFPPFPSRLGDLRWSCLRNSITGDLATALGQDASTNVEV